MTRTILTLDDATAQATAFIEARRALHGDARMDATDDGANGTDDGTSADGQTDDGSPEETPEEKVARLEAKLAETQAHARKHEDRAKANKKAADELARIKASSATDEEKLADAQRIAAEATRDLARYKVAAETGVPADLIAGEDEDSMRTFAEALKAFRGEQTPATRTTPRQDPSQGPRTQVKKTAAELAREAYERRHPKKN